MAKFNQPFDANTVSPNPVFETLPEGEYLVMITDSEMKTTKAGDGEYLNMALEVIDGPYKGRIIFDRLNLVNKNVKAVDIAQRQLSQICHAIGVLRVSDSAELHGKPMIAKIGLEPGGAKAGGGKYEDKNTVKSYRPAGAVAPAAPAQPAPAHGAVAKPGTVPPWAKKAV